MNEYVRQKAIQNIIDSAKPSHYENAQQIEMRKHLMMQNKEGAYKNTDLDKERIFQELYSKVDKIKNTEEVIYGNGKNLIYFSIFLSEDFLSLLDLCLKYILKNSKDINFELLFITDEIFKEKIISLDIYKNFTCHFHIIDPPLTGIVASTKKLIIHDFSMIENYEKILYLDCDIICIKDIKHILNIETLPEFLYAATNNRIKSAGLCSPCHSLMYLTKKDAEYLFDNTDVIFPFNAGQFLFLNTKRMRLHFENIRWLLEVWPDIFFFEQSFMNHYFVLNGLIKNIEDGSSNALVSLSNRRPTFFSGNRIFDENGRNLNLYNKRLLVYGATSSSYAADKLKHPSGRGSMNHVDLESVDKLVHMEHTPDSVLLHFANLSLNGSGKLKFIQDYINAYKL